MITYEMKRYEANVPEYAFDLDGDELNLIEMALLELLDNIQYEDNLDAEQKLKRHDMINNLLIKLGDM